MSPGPRPALSICITVKNRSRVDVDGHELKLFPNCVRSLAAAIPEDLQCELVVADWRSDDWPLKEWIEAAADPIPVTVAPLDGEFSRGRGRNEAACCAEADHLLFIDADCLVPTRLFTRGLEVVESGRAFFPVLYSFLDFRQREGWWRHRGYGNVMLTRSVFEEAGAFPVYNYWGREDVEFFERVSSACPVVREKVPGLFHQWHPDDFEWKNRFGAPSPHHDQRCFEEQVGLRIRADLGRLIRAGEQVLIAGQVELEPGLLADFLTRDFNEGDGVDWGPPADGGEAVRRLERARAEGAKFLVFHWATRWWLEHYRELASHLERRYERVLDEEHLVLFALGNRGSETP